MEPPPLPPDVRALIASSIHSSAVLDLLFLLRRSPDTYWTAAAAGAAIGASDVRIDAALHSLEHRGLLQRARESIAFRYAPASESDRRTVDLLASVYETRRVDVLDAVYASGAAGIKAFADAFRIRQR